ncbi:FecR domain-containing protein [Sphingomonas sp. HF-S3]|uniref:FecR domain-containing protein n=1 Tax=Sphingomonas rustica TaxID=3103142 RepID=A0ABV0B4B2_9SPHN
MTREPASQIEHEAAGWVARMDGASWDDALESALDRWLAGDPRRSGALLQAQAAWATLDRDMAGAGHAVRPLSADDHVPLRAAGRRRFLIGGGAAIAASLIGTLLLVDRLPRYETEIGEIRRVPLADGSTMAINTGSLATVDLEPNRRSVRIDRGELWFQVAKDPGRPFIVEAGPVRVQAVGTAFAVRRRDRGADIFVTEGVVEAWSGEGQARHIRIAAGEHAYIADDASITRSPADATSVYRALAWREGKIDLSGVTLAEAAAEFNRYNHRRLVIADPAIGGETFDGILRTDDLEGFAMAVRDSLNVPVDFSDPTEVRVGRKRK